MGQYLVGTSHPRCLYGVITYDRCLDRAVASRRSSFSRHRATNTCSDWLSLRNRSNFRNTPRFFTSIDESKNVYVIINGRVSLAIFDPKGGARELMQVGDGELVGWSPLVGRRRFVGYRYHADASQGVSHQRRAGAGILSTRSRVRLCIHAPCGDGSGRAAGGDTAEIVGTGWPPAVARCADRVGLVARCDCDPAGPRRNQGR